MMVIMEKNRSRNVSPMQLNRRPGATRSTTAAPNVASMIAVPEADNMLSVNFAAYGAGLATTGGRRLTRPSRPGQETMIVALSSRALKGGYPQSSTRMTSRIYGDQARTTARAGGRGGRVAAAAARAIFGRQKRSRMSRPTTAVSEARMSVRYVADSGGRNVAGPT